MASTSTPFFFFVVVIVVVYLLSAASVSAVTSKITFENENLIRSVTDGIHDNAEEMEYGLFHLLGRTRHALSFAQFAVRHRKKYESVEEIKHRFGLFVESVNLVSSHNSKKLSYSLGLNQFADMTWEEFSGRHLGSSQNCSATNKGKHVFRAEALPETRDWRKDGIVSPVKNQGSCGSCWTFSTTGALEAAYTQLTGRSISLSEQQLVDCAAGFNNFGCSGGLPSQAFQYIKYNGGLDTEDSYPYAGANGICNFKKDAVGVKVINSVNITEGAEDELKYAVGLVRPVSVAFQVVDSFKLYKEGVYTSDDCGSGPTDVNHAVLAVGYGVENGIPYWLIKNSWGENWGLNGYFKMEMGKNMCGIATCASYPIIAE